jgi:chitodextrinase
MCVIDFPPSAVKSLLGDALAEDGGIAAMTLGESDPKGDSRSHGRSRPRAVAVLIALALTILPVDRASGAQTLTFPATADATISSRQPSANMGSTTKLSVDSSPRLDFLIRFTPATIAGRRVTSAKVRLYNTNKSPKGGDFYRVANNTWGESTLTWSNAPAADVTKLASLGAVASGNWYEIDVTSLVSADGTYSLRAISTSNDGADFTSKEGTTSFRPQLVVVVDPVPDTTPPSTPAGLDATATGSTRIALTWSASQDNIGVDHYVVNRGGVDIGTSSAASYSDTTVLPETTYTYVVRAYDAAGNESDASAPASATTPAVATGFVFAAAGDHGANSNSAASLSVLDHSGASFYLALGDLDYDQTATDAAWCDYVKQRLPTLGPTFPFELVSGNHEAQGGPNGYILNHAACLPDRLSSTLSPTNQYAAEYFFDYPQSAPLARVIMIAADLTVENVAYDYTAGSARYGWLAGAIDSARANGIPWVIVGMHKDCLSTGQKSCEIGAALMNLLVEKKVDLVLQGHDHNYQRGKQLGLDPNRCPAVAVGTYVQGCVIDDGIDGIYPKGTGTVFLIDGTFGQGLYATNLADPEAPYFAKLNSTTWGLTTYTVSADRIEARFVPSVGSFTDSFTILAGAQPSADTTSPSAPTDLAAAAPAGTRVDLTWTASQDNVGVDHYAIWRDGVQIATSTTNAFSDFTTVGGATYTYAVVAYDTAGNVSTFSNTATITTPGASTTVLTFSPAADAPIFSAQPTTNFGSATALNVDGSPQENFLIRFVVSGVGGRTVAGAKLKLYNVNASTSGGGFFRVGDDSWVEGTVTWQNAPAADPTPIATLGAVAVNNWYEIDVSSLITADGTYSIRGSSTSSDGADYTSKEGTTSFRPQLVVTVVQ